MTQGKVRIASKIRPEFEAEAIRYEDSKEGIADVMRFLNTTGVKLYGTPPRVVIGYGNKEIEPGQWLVKDDSVSVNAVFWVWDDTELTACFNILPE